MNKRPGEKKILFGTGPEDAEIIKVPTKTPSVDKNLVLTENRSKITTNFNIPSCDSSDCSDSESDSNPWDEHDDVKSFISRAKSWRSDGEHSFDEGSIESACSSTTTRSFNLMPDDEHNDQREILVTFNNEQFVCGEQDKAARTVIHASEFLNYKAKHEKFARWTWKRLHKFCKGQLQKLYVDFEDTPMKT